MPDQDEFDPIGRDWRRAYDLCVAGHEDVDVVADEILLAVTRMIRRCGGCTTFREMELLIQNYWQRLSEVERSDSGVPSQLLAELNQRLDNLACTVSDLRIDVVGIRTTRVVALRLHWGTFQPDSPSALSTYLGTQLVQNLICHRVLDASRSHSLGQAFQTPARAHAYHDAVLDRLTEPLRTIGRRLANNPTGQTIRRLRLIPQNSTERMLFDDNFRIEPGDDVMQPADD